MSTSSPGYLARPSCGADGGARSVSGPGYPGALTAGSVHALPAVRGRTVAAHEAGAVLAGSPRRARRRQAGAAWVRTDMAHSNEISGRWSQARMRIPVRASAVEADGELCTGSLSKEQNAEQGGGLKRLATVWQRQMWTSPAKCSSPDGRPYPLSPAMFHRHGCVVHSGPRVIHRGRFT